METSLQILANSKNSNTTTAFVNRKALAARLGVQPIFIDKLVYQGLTSQGTSGLVEKGTIVSLTQRKPTSPTSSLTQLKY